MSYIILVAAAAMFGCHSAYASNGENIPAGTRVETLETRIEDLKESQELEQGSDQAKHEQLQGSAKGIKGIYATSHMGAFYTIKTVSLSGSIELMDGSIWLVSANDAYTPLSWFTSDLLIITPNHDWFSSYNFKITNQSTGEAILVNMYLGPLYSGAYTYWISAIDYSNNIVFLNDGSRWDMSFFDRKIVKKWLVNDTVMIGINDGSLSSYNPNILINVNMLNYARGDAHP